MNTSPAGTGHTLPRRILTALFPGRPPRGRRAVLMTWALRRTASFADWLHYNAEIALLELEDRHRE